MKHGIVIKEHKCWNTKQIWNRGTLLCTYRHVPKSINFSSIMINDTNQHLCGGWFIDEIDDVNQTTFDRVLAGVKPMGVVSYDKDEELDLKRYKQACEQGLPTYISKTEKCLYVCQNGTLSQLFDLATLKTDYQANIPYLNWDQFDEFKDRELKSFFTGWDWEEVPIWVTGLILGYPIENTIAIYRFRFE